MDKWKCHGIDWLQVKDRVRERDTALAIALKFTGAPGGRAYFLSDGHIRIELDPVLQPPQPPQQPHMTVEQYLDALRWGQRET